MSTSSEAAVQQYPKRLLRSTTAASVTLTALALVLVSPLTKAATMPVDAHGNATVPDAWLLAQKFPSWWYVGGASESPRQLTTRSPRPAEAEAVSAAERLASTPGVRAVVLIDGPDVVFSQVTGPATTGSYFHGFSMGKTITSLAAGKAVCEGKLSLGTSVEEVVPQFKDTHMGGASLRDLLTMSSGAKPGEWSGEVFTKEQSAERDAGRLKYLDAMVSPGISSQERGVLSGYRHGEHFVYKNSDPNVVGLMLSRATGMTYASWLQQSVFAPMGMAHDAAVVQDRGMDGQAEGGVRLQLDDWVRFAIWVKESSEKPDCFGDFVREASKRQIRNVGVRASGKAFAGYGYFMWTDNEYAPDSFWASGYGGQRIGWSTRNNRVVLVFSTTEATVLNQYSLQRAWSSPGEH